MNLAWRAAYDHEPRSVQPLVHSAVGELLRCLGEDPDREGLADTPKRVVKAWREMTAGYEMDPEAILATTFDGDGHDTMVLLRRIDFVSLCEHHLLPFIGQAHVGYMPANGRVVGLSKLARLVECFAQRLQIQERMTTEIADALDFHLKPRGVGVIVQASHACMSCRGIRKAGAEMVTQSLLGTLREDFGQRSEFLGAVSAP